MQRNVQLNGVNPFSNMTDKFRKKVSGFGWCFSQLNRHTYLLRLDNKIQDNAVDFRPLVIGFSLQCKLKGKVTFPTFSIKHIRTPKIL